jgi:hypothetical protein
MDMLETPKSGILKYSESEKNKMEKPIAKIGTMKKLLSMDPSTNTNSKHKM